MWGSVQSKIPPSLLQKIKEKLNLVDLASEHVVLRKTGSNHVGLCPFHSERSPSFSVSESKQLYHCYGCKAGGDLISFFSQIQGLSFIETIEELAERAGLALPRGSLNDPSGIEDPEAAKRRAEIREKQTLAYRLNRFAAAQFRKNLEVDQPEGVRPYLGTRGVGVDLERLFYVGSALSSWEGLAQRLKSSQAPLALAAELGLVRPSTKAQPGSSGYFDLFRNRVVFPILGLNGKISGFGGRSLEAIEKGIEKGAEDPAAPKYLNSPDSFLFHKSKLAFGLFQAQKHMREQDQVILVEGYFDVLAMHAAGFSNTVAVCGTALTAEHLQIFRRLSDRVLVLFDGDHAGIQAMDRAMITALEQGIVIYGAFLPKGLDPDELVLKGPQGVEELKSLIQNAQPLLDLRLGQAIQEASKDNETRVRVLKQIAGWLTKFKDPVGREVRLEHLERELGVSRRLLSQSLNEFKGAESTQQSRAQVPRAVPSNLSQSPKHLGQDRLSSAERILIRALALWNRYGEYFRQATQHLPAGMTICDLFDYGPAKSLTLLVFSSGNTANSILGQLSEAPQVLLEQTQDKQLIEIISETLVIEESEIEPHKIALAFKKRLTLLWARFSQTLKTDMAQAERQKETGLQENLMKDYLDVQRKMKELNTFYDKGQ